MELIIAEKPSVAHSIAKVLGAGKRGDGYMEGNDYIVSWCLGHLVEPAPPHAYNPAYAKWRAEDLPILPEVWKYETLPASKKQFFVLKKLMQRKDVDSLICATDAGREGELIFRHVYHQAGCRKPFRRLWISSMEDAAIREGMKHLKPSSAYDLLYEAALCREKADWIVGMNASRLFSCLNDETLNVGRVMTPTLAMIVERDREIATFHSQPFYTVQIGPEGKKLESRRFAERKEAEELLERCLTEGKAKVTCAERKEKHERPPLLYDLTTLQKDASRFYGYTAKQTLDYTQSLYEKKLVTYPRTDSRYLTEDMKYSMPALIKSAADKFGLTAAEFDTARRPELFDSAKVSDHSAILPTAEMAGKDTEGLSDGELSVLKLITAGTLAAFGPDAVYEEEKLEALCGGEAFTRSRKKVLEAGWKAVYRSLLPGKEPAAAALPLKGSTYAAGDAISVGKAALREGKTTPPKAYTEDTLLTAMEKAGEGEIPEEAERKGLGTPATRAGIIEKLVQKGFIERRGSRKEKSLNATEKGKRLIALMPEEIRSASLTAKWEQKLLEIEQGKLRPEAFMKEIEAMMENIVREETAKAKQKKQTRAKGGGST